MEMNVWKFICGYVNIKVEGSNLQRLLNRATTEGIALANVSKTVGGAMYAEVSMRDMKKLRHAVRGCGCKIKILSKKGAPRVLFSLRRNVAFAAFSAIAALLLFFVATRVWHISVDCGSIDSELVMEALSDMGVSVGSLRRDIEPSKISEFLAKNVRGIANADVTLNGVVLSVDVNENDVVSPSPIDERPASVYADKDCIISSISVSRGRAVVKAGMAVSKGDLLINGDLSENKEGYSVHAQGTVEGMVLYRFTGTASQETVKLIRSGSICSVGFVRAMGVEITGDIPYANYELEYEKGVTIDSCGVPVFIGNYVCYELIEKLVVDDAEGTEERALLAAQQRMSSEIPKEARIVSVSHSVVWNDDGSATATVVVETIERIGIKRYF